MIIGRVTGSIVATRKNEKLVGCKLMVVEILEKMNNGKTKIIAIDNVGAGIGEVVMVAQGSAARIGCNLDNSPVDAAIVGIVDNGSELEL
ncbi:MAG: EutN/CcmL family microcompartment protein [Clostridia bacterium]|nr:EutN/CcmL family microcompartment protein [Clostridia bacterium]